MVLVKECDNEAISVDSLFYRHLIYKTKLKELAVAKMRTDTEMMELIVQIAESLQVEAVALSGSRTNPRAPKDEFQDYDVVYIVENLNDLLSDLSWLDQFGMRLIEQHNQLV